MAVTSVLNFDAVPGAVDNSAGNNRPVFNAGMQPFFASPGAVGTFDMRQTTVNTANSSMGVTGLAIDRFDNGANALVFFARTLDDVPAIAWEWSTNPMNAQTPFRYTTGFRFKIPTGNPTGMPFAHTFLQATANLTTVLNITNAYLLMFVGASTGITLAIGKEYYFEVVIEHAGVPSGSNYTPSMHLYIDGTFIMTRAVTTYTAPTTCYWRFSLTSAGAGATVSQRRFLLGDVYSTNNVGDAPYNGRLGPQRVKTFVPKEVVANTWTPSTGTDPLALITGANARDDTKYLTAPDSDGVTSYKMNMPTADNSIVNGVFLMARAMRTDTAVRTMVGSLTSAGGTALGEGAPVTLTTTMTDRLLGSFVPTTAAQALNYRNSALQNAVFGIKAPI